MPCWTCWRRTGCGPRFSAQPRGPQPSRPGAANRCREGTCWACTAKIISRCCPNPEAALTGKLRRPATSKRGSPGSRSRCIGPAMDLRTGPLAGAAPPGSAPRGWDFESGDTDGPAPAVLLHRLRLCTTQRPGGQPPIVLLHDGATMSPAPGITTAVLLTALSAWLPSARSSPRAAASSGCLSGQQTATVLGERVSSATTVAFLRSALRGWFRRGPGRSRSPPCRPAGKPAWPQRQRGLTRDACSNWVPRAACWPGPWGGHLPAHDAALGLPLGLGRPGPARPPAQPPDESQARVCPACADMPCDCPKSVRDLAPVPPPAKRASGYSAQRLSDDPLGDGQRWPLAGGQQSMHRLPHTKAQNQQIVWDCLLVFALGLFYEFIGF